MAAARYAAITQFNEVLAMRKNRNIRAGDQEWADFMAHMGTDAFRELCGDLAQGKTKLVRSRSGLLEIKRKK